MNTFESKITSRKINKQNMNTNIKGHQRLSKLHRYSENNAKGNSKGNNFVENDCIFIFNCEHKANVSRFFHHSCDPNLFVQNVFIDTYDLRFPHVAFFASNYIQAGTELTWNYMYTIGSVPGKVIMCSCGSKNCKGRLL